MNIFEGARRVLKIAIGFTLIGGVIAIATNKPYTSLYFGATSMADMWPVSGCEGKPQFRPHVSGRDEWVTVVVCGWDRGPDEITLPPILLGRLDDAMSKKRWGDIGEALGAVAGIIVFLYAISWAIGWVVRGFLGIPAGSDRKITSLEN